MSAVDGLSGLPGIWRHTTKPNAPSRFFSSTSGRRVAPLAMLTKTPGIFIIHWLSIETPALLELSASQLFGAFSGFFGKGSAELLNVFVCLNLVALLKRLRTSPPPVVNLKQIVHLVSQVYILGQDGFYPCGDAWSGQQYHLYHKLAWMYNCVLESQ